MRRLRLAAAAAATITAALLVAACAEAPVAPEATPTSLPDAALLIVYRPHSDANATNYPFVYVEWLKMGPLPDGGVVRAEMAPGSHRVMLSNPALWEGQQYWQINATPGRRYYYRVRVGDFSGEDSQNARYLSKALRVDQVTEEAATAELRMLEASAS
jgi:hypothetical protein